MNALDAVSPELVLVSPQLGRPDAAAEGLADSILAGEALSERELARLLASQMGLPFVDLEHSAIDVRARVATTPPAAPPETSWEPVEAPRYAIQGGEYGTLDLVRQHRQRVSLLREIDSLKHTVDSLKEYKQRVLTDPKTQERIAREEFGMVRGKELLYRIAEPSPDSTP